MQTFLPYPNLITSAQALDPKRRFNQINEVMVIAKTLTGYYGTGKGWPHHPAVKMWTGHVWYLVEYGLTLVQSVRWNAHLFTDRQIDASFQMRRNLLSLPISRDTPVSPAPSWFGDEAFHSAHRAILLAKLPEWYGRFGWEEQPAQMVNGKYPYIWPKVV